MRYCLGFIFNEDFRRVILLEKQRGVKIKGSLNGVGGGVEPWSTPIVAMRRKCLEETGLEVPLLNQFAIYNVRDWGREKWFHRIFCYWAVIGNNSFAKARTTTDEQVFRFNVDDVMTGNVPQVMVPDLQWLMQMALHHRLADPKLYFNLYEYYTTKTRDPMEGLLESYG